MTPVVEVVEKSDMKTAPPLRFLLLEGDGGRLYRCPARLR